MSRRAVMAHRLALGAVRPLIRPRAVAVTGRPRVTVLLMDAYGLSGVVRTVLNLAGYLALHHDVEVLSIMRRREQSSFPLPPGVRVTVVEDRRAPTVAGWRRAVRAVLSRCKGRLVHPSAREAVNTTLWTDVKLVRALRRIRGGVVIGTGPALNVLAAQLTRPGVATVGQEHLFYDFRRPEMQAAMRRAGPSLDAMVVLTETDRRAYGAALGPGARVVCIPNAVPSLDGSASDVSRPVVLAAGRLTAQKGFDRLIGGFARIAREAPEWRLRIAGRGPSRKRLEDVIVRTGVDDNVALLGAVSDMGAEMRDASVFVLSSRWEGFPLVLIEAMSKGLAVVSFDCPTGPADIVVDGENGYLVPDGDTNALVDRVLDLIRDEPKRRRFGQAAAETAQHYALERIGPRWDELIADLTGRSRAGA